MILLRLMYACCQDFLIMKRNKYKNKNIILRIDWKFSCLLVVIIRIIILIIVVVVVIACLESLSLCLSFCLYVTLNHITSITSHPSRRPLPLIPISLVHISFVIVTRTHTSDLVVGSYRQDTDIVLPPLCPLALV